MRKQEIEEGLGELADVAERDHEVQMARADLYKLAKYAIKLHEMLKTVSEAEGIEGWQQAKITKAADYLGSVYHSLDYDMAHDGGQLGESNSTNKIALLESTEFLAMPDHLVDVYLESLTIEQLEILEEGVLGAIGRGIKGTAKLAAKGALGGAKLAAKGAVGGAKLAAKGAKSAVVNKQGNLRLSTAGRADGAEAKLAKIQAKKNAKINKAAKLKKDQERLAKAKAGIAQTKNKPAPVGESKDTHCSDKCCGATLKREDCKCPPDCEHCNCNDPKVEEGKFKSAAHRKAVHAGKASGKKKKTSLRKESLQDRLASKLAEANSTCDECGNPSYKTLPEEKQKGVDGKVCWKGYKRMGTKKKGGKTVDNCVKM